MKKTLTLKCELTMQEVNDLAKEISSFLNSKTEVEIEKKETVKRLNRDIAYWDKKINQHGELIDAGFEDRQVDCIVEINTPTINIKRITRLDTNETWTEPMVLNEANLFNISGVKEEEE